MTQNNRKLIEKKIKEVANQYIQKGYTVFIDPVSHDIPDFLKNFSPDIIAISNDDKVIIEVKSKTTLIHSKELESMANLINQQDGWRFELVVTNSKNLENENQEELSLNAVINMLTEAEKLLEYDFLNASFIIAWSAFETVVRNKLKQENVKSEYTNISQSIKNLYTFGLVSKQEYDFLQNQFKIRNLVVHGFKSPYIDPQNIRILIALIKDVLNYN
ncbi:hypothetical protein [Bacillus thuringiensis]|uniref:hypothetical protein n=1 Tax=Bacillus thuringiensis TaxID=1428 RepID=UPI002D7E9D94|nr:hypothetical protein [Bacillus thuringiensis]MEB4818897.1 hypothetical protein [Bacillus thuringiensis]